MTISVFHGISPRDPRFSRKPLAAAVMLVCSTLMLSQNARAELEVPLDTEHLMTISGNGSVTAGYFSAGGGLIRVGNGTAQGNVTTLPLPSGYTDMEVFGLSHDGSVAVGVQSGFDDSWNYIAKAFKWTSSGGVVQLNGLVANGNSSASGVSADGSVIVGGASDGLDVKAVRWVNGSLTPINLAQGSTYFPLYSRAQGVSSDGTTVVGYGQNAGMAYEAFRWTADAGMVGLGFLPGKDSTEAIAASSNGSYIVGTAYTMGPTINSRAVRWDNGTIQDIGVLSVSGVAGSKATGISADGSVVVGSVLDGTGSQIAAFRWTPTTNMQSVADWLTTNGVDVGTNQLKSANGVSADGNVVVGSGVINGMDQSYIARVGSGSTGGGSAGSGSTGGGSTGGGSTGWGSPMTGLIGVSHFTRTLSRAASMFGTGASFTQMTLFGAHHRPLMDMGLPGGNCAWATADYGSSHRTDVRQRMEEVGVCGDLGSSRLGIGIGHSSVSQDIDLGGNGDYRGMHVMAEADYRIGTSLLTSLTGLYGHWDVNMDRNYQNGAVIDTSHGDTDARVWALRARLDWLDMVQLGRGSLSPFVAYTHTRSMMDGYTETGGGFPVRFDDSNHTARELRVGASLKNSLASQADLRVTAEAVHRFDGNGATVSGQIVGLGNFSFSGGDIKQNWARAGAEVDYRVTSASVLSASMNVSTQGEDATWSGSVSWKVAF